MRWHDTTQATALHYMRELQATPNELGVGVALRKWVDVKVTKHFDFLELLLCGFVGVVQIAIAEVPPWRACKLRHQMICAHYMNAYVVRSMDTDYERTGCCRIS